MSFLYQMRFQSPSSVSFSLEHGYIDLCYSKVRVVEFGSFVSNEFWSLPWAFLVLFWTMVIDTRYSRILLIVRTQAQSSNSGSGSKTDSILFYVKWAFSLGPWNPGTLVPEFWNNSIDLDQDSDSGLNSDLGLCVQCIRSGRQYSTHFCYSVT